MVLSNLQDLASQFETSAGQIRALVERTCGRLPQEQYYIFRVNAENEGAPASARARAIAAFPTPDDALAFAQRNGYAASAQLRQVSAGDLIAALLGDPAVSTLLFLPATNGDERPRSAPSAVTITRQSLIDQLRPVELEKVALTAKAFDALQFGVDFARRGAFRAELTEAVEAVVMGYTPPPGSLDSGSRSVYATNAVETWLRDHGFPHARQRRWVNVAGEPGWNGAEELYEIDCGTEQRLLVQLLIHNDGARQFIGRIVVTS
jgi:hypothetical protein